MNEVILDLKASTGPLKNRLGHNGPYIGGMRDPIDRDCDRVPGHTGLFRDLESFEADLVTAGERIEARAEAILASEERPKLALPRAIAALREAARYLADSYLLAQVLDERERRRLQALEQGSIHELVLRDMGSAELAETLLKLEERSRDTRRMIATIHAERDRRNAR